MAGYDTVPKGASIQVDKFTLSIPDQEIQDFKTLLRLSKLAPKTYENLHTDAKDCKFGVSHEWMSKAKEYWLNEYDWYIFLPGEYARPPRPADISIQACHREVQQLLPELRRPRERRQR